MPLTSSSLLLPFGLDSKGEFVFIDQVPKGKSKLFCPFCKQQLTAKKGAKKQHHFAHTGSSCVNWPGHRNKIQVKLPLYDYFEPFSSTSILAARSLYFKLKKVNFYHDDLKNEPLRQLINEGVIEDNIFAGGYRFTLPALVAIKRLSLNKFSEYQSLYYKDYHASSSLQGDMNELIFRNYIRNLKGQHLYFCEIQADDKKIWKIGVTTRDFPQRENEILIDLKKHFSSVKIKLLHFKEYMGRIERYFKFKYMEKYSYSFGSHTEYFDFGKDISKIKRDFTSVRTLLLLEYLSDEPWAYE